MINRTAFLTIIRKSNDHSANRTNLYDTKQKNGDLQTLLNAWQKLPDNMKLATDALVEIDKK